MDGIYLSDLVCEEMKRADARTTIAVVLVCGAAVAAMGFLAVLTANHGKAITDLRDRCDCLEAAVSEDGGDIAGIRLGQLKEARRDEIMLVHQRNVNSIARFVGLEAGE